MNAKLLSDVINTSSGRCWSSEVYNPVPGVLSNVPASNNYNVSELFHITNDFQHQRCQNIFSLDKNQIKDKFSRCITELVITYKSKLTILDTTQLNTQQLILLSPFIAFVSPFLLQGGFKISLLAKDMKLAENLANRCTAQTDLSKLATSIYKRLMDKGCQDKDFSYIYEFLKNKT